MISNATFIAAAALAAGLALPAVSHATVTLYNAEGASAPCIGIGPLAEPVVQHCAQMYEEQGFVRAAVLGASGLTLATTGGEDGVVTKIEPGSPAALAGMAIGDRVVAVDGHSVRRPLGEVAAQRLFGKRGDKLSITVRRGGSDIKVNLVLAAETAPPGPKWDNMLVMNRLLVDWRGDFAPCLGVGPLAMGALAFCTSHFRPFGFVEASAMGGAGLKMNMDKIDMATIAAVEPGSPAAAAGLQPGDQIVAVNGQPLIASLGGEAKERLFGKAGDTRRVTVRRGGEEKSFALTLAPAQK
jgi:S1-C subfamily serine protease